jgi:O-antigen/teichoic acid export membrane protein
MASPSAARDWIRTLWGLPREVRSGVLVGWVGSAIQLTVGVVVPSVVVRALGLEDYGRYVMLLSLMGYVSLLDLGLTTALVTRAGQARDAQEWQEALALLRAALVWVALSGGLSVGLAAVVGARSQGLSFAPLFVLAAALGLMSEILGSVVRGRGRVDRYNAVVAATAVVTASVACAAVIAGRALAGLAAAQLVAAGVRLLALGWLAGQAIPEPTAIFRGPIRLRTRDLAIGLSDQVNRVWLGFVSPSLRLSLAAMGGTVALATYDLASRLVAAVVVPPSVFLPALLPAFASRSDDRDAVRDLLARSVGALQAISLPGVAFLVLFVDPVSRAWIGSAPHHLGLVTRLLVLGGWWNLTTGPFVQALLGTSRPALCNQKAFLGLTLSIVVLPPSLLLGGLRGYALGEALVHVTAATWFLSRYDASPSGSALALVLRSVEDGVKKLLPAVAAVLLVYGATVASSAWATLVAWGFLFAAFSAMAMAPWRALRSALLVWASRRPGG